MENRDLIIYCDRASHSARAIAKVLGCRRWYEDSTPGRKTAPVVPVIINWGASDAPNWIKPELWPWPNGRKYHLLNSTEAVSRAINKIATLEALRAAQVPCLDFVLPQTPNYQETLNGWLNEDGRYIARTRLDGSAGSGLRLVATLGGAVPHSPAPLYTRYYPKTHEFRVHVFKGEVIDFTQKRLRPELVNSERTERLVRSHANGWVHAHTIDGELDTGGIEEIKRGAVAAIQALNLDFGAADILAVFGRPTRLANGRRRALHFRVCEVNTGPGLENSATIAAYADAVDKHYHSIKNRRVIRGN